MREYTLINLQKGGFHPGLVRKVILLNHDPRTGTFYPLKTLALKFPVKLKLTFVCILFKEYNPAYIGYEIE